MSGVPIEDDLIFHNESLLCFSALDFVVGSQRASFTSFFFSKVLVKSKWSSG